MPPQTQREAFGPPSLDARPEGAGSHEGARVTKPPLKLDLPRRFGWKADAGVPAAPLTPAQEALSDPRSNTLRLTAEERRLIARGEAECIAWERLPNGEIHRGPGHLRRVPLLQPNPINGRVVKECVRG